MSEIPRQSKPGSLTLIQALQNGQNSKVRRSIFGTNPISVETLCREQHGVPKEKHRLLQYRVLRDNLGEKPSCRIRECSPADCSLPHSNVTQSFLLPNLALAASEGLAPARPTAREDGGP